MPICTARRFAGLFAVALALSLVVLPPLSSEPLSGIVQTQQALERSRSSGKPVLLMFAAYWCGYSTMMRESISRHPQLAKAIARFEFVDVEVGDQKRPLGKDLRKQLRFELRTVPTFVLLDGQGEVAKVQTTDGMNSGPGTDYDPGKVAAALEQLVFPPQVDR